MAGLLLVVVVILAIVGTFFRSLRGDTADDAVDDDDEDDAFFLLYVRILSFSAKFRVSFKFLSMVVVVDAEKFVLIVAELNRLPYLLLLSIKSDSSFENV